MYADYFSQASRTGLIPSACRRVFVRADRWRTATASLSLSVLHVPISSHVLRRASVPDGEFVLL